MDTFKKEILDKIKNGELDMKPKWHFVLKSALLLVGTVIAALLAVYFLSFVIFTLKETGVGFSVLYGFKGISLFVMHSPWILISATVVFVGILYLLITHYSFSYQKPLVYSMVGVVLFALVGSVIIEQTTMHAKLQQYSEQTEVPVFPPMYRGAKALPTENIVHGEILEVTEQGLIVESVAGEIVIDINERTRQRPGSEYRVGERVIIYGEKNDGRVQAFGIRPAGEVRDRIRERVQEEVQQRPPAGERQVPERPARN